MRKLFLLSAFALVTLLSGCELIGDIFKAGLWVGIIIVVAILVLVFWLLSKIRG